MMVHHYIEMEREDIIKGINSLMNKLNFYKNMDGQYLNKKKVKKSIQEWINTIIPPEGKWESNYVYIHEIESLKRIKRENWIDTSFHVFDLIMNMKPIDSLILFLHINLKWSSQKLHLDKLTLNWLKDNVNEFYQPSFHYTSFEYFDELYKNELISCNPDASILELIPSSSELSFFYRTYFDEDEDMFPRKIYVFAIILSSFII